MQNYSIILLAAGLSKRMGRQNKLLLPFQETTLVEFCADRLLYLNARATIVVTGHQAPEVQFRLHDRPFIFTYNKNFKNGMTSSIQQGLSVCHTESKGILICQSDMPNLILRDLLKIESSITKLIEDNKKGIIAPFVDQRMGNPVFFSHHFFNDILDHKTPNGCKSIIQENLDSVIKVKFENKDSFSDIDTKADYLRY